MRPAWLIALLLSLLGILSFGASLYQGPGIWSLSQHAPWGFPIVNFVFWIGVAHAGTFLSAILYLFRFPGRGRFAHTAELTTLCAWVVAALYPLFHLGRPWLFHWVVPMPGAQGLWPQPTSPLVWDVLAIGTYGLMSVVFLVFSLRRLRTEDSDSLQWAYALVLAPTVILVHTIVSFDFACTFIPAWRSALLPPYFVIGALASGLSLVLLCLPLAGMGTGVRKRASRQIAPLLAICSALLGWMQLTGTHVPPWWVLLLTSVIPQLLWIRPLRRSMRFLYLTAGGVLLGLWWERFDLVAITLREGGGLRHASSLGFTWADAGITLGGVGFFFVMFLFSSHRLHLDGGGPAVRIRRPSMGLVLHMVGGGAISAGLSWWFLALYPMQVWPRQVGDWSTALSLRVSPALLALLLLGTGAGASLWYVRRQSVRMPAVLSRWTWAWLLGTLVLGGAVGWWSSLSGHEWESVRQVVVPPALAVRPVEHSPSGALGKRGGQEIWTTYCTLCHGKDGAGSGRPEWMVTATNLVDSAAGQRPDSLWRSVILDGRRNMPAFRGRISMAELDSVVVWIREQGRRP